VEEICHSVSQQFVCAKIEITPCYDTINTTGSALHTYYPIITFKLEKKCKIQISRSSFKKHFS
jgi:hypothetical protein